MGVLVLALAGVPMTGASAVTVMRHSYISGNELHMWCQNDNLDPCAAYILGVTDTVSLNGGTTAGWRVCKPLEGVIIGQVRDIIIAFLKAHPEKRHGGAANLVVQALAEAFPCPAN